jgi:LmbE family N-acetylglucosaminyl deacetylase
MNILVLAPHPDDEVIGCGGTLCKNAARGDRVVAVFLTSGELGLKHLPREKAWRIREAEARKAARILKLAAVDFLRMPDWTLNEHLRQGARRLQPILKREAPELIYLPHPREWHPDHRATLPILRAALRGAGIRKPELRGFEVWTPLADQDYAEDISAVMALKLRALRAHRSQLGEFEYVRAVKGLNQSRGALAAKCGYAEVFQTLQVKAR